MKTPPHFDIAEHLRIWRRHVLPIFTAVGALMMIAFVALRAGSSGAPLPEEGHVAAPVGLLPAGAGARFDPAFAVLSPVEMALSPRAVVFDCPLPQGSAEGDSASPVAAAADGLVLFAGPFEGAYAVLLSHETAAGIVGSFYAGLGPPRVAPGTRVRRRQVLGAVPHESGGDGGAGGFRFEWRSVPSLDLAGAAEPGGTAPAVLGDTDVKRLSPPPEEIPAEPGSFLLDSEPADGGQVRE